ncbi:sigma-70 family RNA polymerase sigma factor [Planobispora takensis]|uniref:RNA polymerase sigma factor n=1 Tax=Planobispora takensis TaxID=1367882 RepID=A0A8J3WVX4_9ACTN|nr:sigma-70 family RNA polymerase sigma factor [Planobispora takensis]GII03173.1 RNA polymerase sigma factor [Planobispora takensis]
MPEDGCQVCGRALPERAGRRGRSSVYCSAACRQKAYRSRHDPATGAEIPAGSGAGDGRDGFRGRSTPRAWLYRIATNTCLDFLRRTTRRVTRYEPVEGMDHGSQDPPPRITWLQPYPDHLLEDLEGAVSGEASPEAAAVSGETVELVCLAAIQHLPPRQRAVLILRDVLGLPAAETATMLEMSTASVNSALQRARPALLSEDIRLTMPPNPFWFTGREAMTAFLRPSLDPASPSHFGNWRHLPTRANGRPAAAGYVQRPGTTVYRAQVLDVLRVQDGKIVEIMAFEPHLFPAFGLPLRL